MPTTTPKKATPKSLGLRYCARKSVWQGRTESAPEHAEMLLAYGDEPYARWEENGYRYNRLAGGQTTAYRV